MGKPKALEQGEIYWADLGERRMVIVVSRESLNRGSYVTVVPVTSAHFARRSSLATCVAFRAGEFCFTADCVAQAENISLVEKGDLSLGDGPLDRLDAEAMRNVVRAIGQVIEAECEQM